MCVLKKMHFAESYFFAHHSHSRGLEKTFLTMSPSITVSLSSKNFMYVFYWTQVTEILILIITLSASHHVTFEFSSYVVLPFLSLWVQSAVLYFFWPTTKTFPRISYQVILKRKQFDYIYSTTGYVWIGNIFQLIFKAVTPKYKLITFILFFQWIPSKS